jgi:recombination protein RecA
MAKEKKDGGRETVDAVVGAIKEKFGDEMIMKLGEVKKVDVAAIPTGSVSLDIALGIGGVPRGRVIEVYGPESSG